MPKKSKKKCKGLRVHRYPCFKHKKKKHIVAVIGWGTEDVTILVLKTTAAEYRRIPKRTLFNKYVPVPLEG